MITSLRLFQRYIYPRQYQHLLRLWQYILSRSWLSKSQWSKFTIPFPLTCLELSALAHEISGVAVKKKCSEATHVQLDEEKIPPLHQLIGWYVESRNSFATCFVFPSCRWYHQISVPQYQLLTVCQQQWSRWSWKPWSEVVEKQAEYWWIWDTSAFKYRCKKKQRELTIDIYIYIYVNV